MTISNEPPVIYVASDGVADLTAAIAYLIVEQAAERWDDNGMAIEWWRPL